jgi:acetyl-CoA synthetase
MAHDNAYVTKTSRQSLKTLATAGEPIDPETWKWYHSVVGKILK